MIANEYVMDCGEGDFVYGVLSTNIFPSTRSEVGKLDEKLGFGDRKTKRVTNFPSSREGLH